MQSFLFTREMIHSVVATAVFGPRDADDGSWTLAQSSTPDDLGRSLIEANRNGLIALGIETDESLAESYRFSPEARTLSALEAAAALDVLEYFAAHSSTWPWTEAAKFVARMRRALIQCLPGYQDLVGEVALRASGYDESSEPIMAAPIQKEVEYDFNQDVPAAHSGELEVRQLTI